MRKASKKATACAVLGAIALAGAGSLAIFTDRAEGTATATAGTLDIELAQTWVDDNDTYNLEKRAEVGGDVEKDGLIDPLLPGKFLDMDYTVTNSGNKSVDIRETITIKSAKAFAETPEFLMFKSVQLNADTGAYEGVDQIPYTVDKTANEIIITPAYYSLNGTGAAAETVEGVTSNAKTFDYVILFDDAAANDWMGETITVDYVVEAKQHENTDTNNNGTIDAVDWEILDSTRTELKFSPSGVTQDVVPLYQNN